MMEVKINTQFVFNVKVGDANYELKMFAASEQEAKKLLVVQLHDVIKQLSTPA